MTFTLDFSYLFVLLLKGKVAETFRMIAINAAVAFAEYFGEEVATPWNSPLKIKHGTGQSLIYR